MKCPVCGDVDLASVPYEGVAVSLCPRCHGVLLTKNALNRIERNPEMERSVLEMEVDDSSDSEGVLKCPKCRVGMRKEQSPHGLDFSVDICESCGLLWLDHGELEALQIAFEESPAGRDMIERRKIMSDMSDERREALNANIAKARDRIPNPVDDPNRFNLLGGEYRRERFSILGSLIDSFFNL